MVSTSVNDRPATKKKKLISVSTLTLVILLLTAFTFGFVLCSSFFLLTWQQADPSPSTHHHLSIKNDYLSPTGASTSNLVNLQSTGPYCTGGWKQTSKCNPDGPREPHLDRSCKAPLAKGTSGYCVCARDNNDNQIIGFGCGHTDKITCEEECKSQNTAKDNTGTNYLRAKDEKVDGTIASCKSSIRNPPDKLDIVIPYENRGDTDISLMYELRSFEKQGILDHVGTVFIIAETSEDVKQIQARFNNYMIKMADNEKEKETKERITQLNIIALDEIKVPFNVERFKKNVKLAKPHYSPYLPNLAEYYLLVPDDIFMLREYRQDIWFDPAKSLPYAHSFGSFNSGATKGFPNIAEMHGVNFLNRCMMQYVIEKYNVPSPEQLSPVAVAIGMMKRDNLLAGFYGYNSGSYQQVSPYQIKFFAECHTNGGCLRPNFRETFVNIQGDGISIEYRKNDKVGELFRHWFKTTFPLPSRFE